MGATWNDRLDAIAGSFEYFLPELLLIGVFLVLIFTSFFTRKQNLFLSITAVAHFGSLVLLATSGFSAHAPLFDGMLRHDGLASWLKLLIDASVVLACGLTTSRAQERPGEYSIVLTAIAIGCHLLVMANNFVIIFIALEIVSVGSYVLAGFSFSRLGSEGSMKYFLFGAMASAVMLYGFSFIYGMAGTLRLDDPVLTNFIQSADSPLFFAAGMMAIAGFLYKIAGAPMHFWAPDVYAAAPTPVIAFFSVAPKLAGLGVLIRFTVAVNAFGLSPFDWQTVLAIISLVTITAGNVAALRQTDPKRMMAYSSIAHGGFLLIGLVAFSVQGLHSLLFYASVYMAMNFCVFAILAIYESRGIDTIPAFAGTGTAFAGLSIILVIGLISLTGIPPTAGFTAKLIIFSALWEGYGVQKNPALLWLLIIGLCNTVVALFYYLRIPYQSFMRPAARQITGGALQAHFPLFIAAALAIVLLALFFVPGLLMSWINKITFT